MSLGSLADSIDFTAPSSTASPFAKHVLVYFVTGNPGFIEYYRETLSALSQRLSSGTSKHGTQYHIHGTSLPGFEIQSKRPKKVQTLDDIKEQLIQSINTKAAELAEQHDVRTSAVPVVLIGHSIGAWLILEAITESLNKKSEAAAHIASAMLLFPTIVDIAKSPNGINMSRMLWSRHAAFVLSVSSRVFFTFMPLSLLVRIVSLFSRSPKHPASVTATMLKTRRLVEQALTMGHFEMLQVTEDAYSDELWGVTEAKEIVKKSVSATEGQRAAPALFFYYGQDDEWVANSTRDAIIKSRARSEALGDELKPTMVIDKHGLPHAFPLTETGPKLIAEQLAEWISAVLVTA